MNKPGSWLNIEPRTQVSTPPSGTVYWESITLPAQHPSHLLLIIAAWFSCGGPPLLHISNYILVLDSSLSPLTPALERYLSLANWNQSWDFCWNHQEGKVFFWGWWLGEQPMHPSTAATRLHFGPSHSQYFGPSHSQGHTGQQARVVHW